MRVHRRRVANDAGAAPTPWRRWVALALTVSASACGIAPTDPSAATLDVAAAKAATASPQILVTYEDSVNVGTSAQPSWVPAAYRGDGRMRNGLPLGEPPVSGAPSNEYQGGLCGVNANVGTGTRGQTTQFTFDPNQYWTSSLSATCTAPRSVLVYWNGSTPGVTQQHQYFPNLGSLVVGQSIVQPWNSGTLAEFGVGFAFDDTQPGASSLRLSRLPNALDHAGRSVRRWRIETRGTHRAMGMVSGSRGLVATGTTYFLPWAMVVTEVLVP